MKGTLIALDCVAPTMAQDARALNGIQSAVNIMDRRAMSRVDTGFYAGSIFGPLKKYCP